MNVYIRDNYQFTTGMWPQVVDPAAGFTVTQCWEYVFPASSGSPTATSCRLLTDLNSDYSRTNRILKHIPHKVKLDYTRLTVTACISACAAEGYTDAGLEYSSECYCDNSTYPVGQSVTMMECNMGCSGDASQFVAPGRPLQMMHMLTTT